jgi:hypothetical protein
MLLFRGYLILYFIKRSTDCNGGIFKLNSRLFNLFKRLFGLFLSLGIFSLTCILSSLLNGKLS